MSADADSADKSQYVQSLARGLSVIAAFDAAQPVMTLSDVARHTGLTRATARRFLLTLESLGYVRSDGRMFELTPKVLQLGYSYLSALSLPQVASPHLKRLSDTLQESTSLSVLDGQDIVYVARVATHRIMTVAIAVGTRFPAYATSMGRVLLADLSAQELAEYLSAAQLSPLTRRTTTERDALAQQLQRVREQGYAVVDQELEVGLRSAAVPVRDRAGRTIAAINVSMRVGMPGVDTDHPETQVIPELLACADAISQDLAASGH
ncbi:helix-turn-helix domain-containing protein [Kocuria sp. cx-455]|uniref:IclR family transcriptional regulator domain-containing protein n=1 Tax=unclassified Candidatus Sulfotelmatobacter TaxID=2635724 RepID=UPI001689101E|nr:MULTISPECIES: IclR family transcriptional regulator C-terminal domain-containing protein [unclassified Candidatus Sulfotelmatobacter]MBD2762354.1 helix-turn-helix domain-containing protein [Kocuria sp. cx-116]MBD2764326.1 helix-turn-helix domain-containing protein [Kocuria sp. cx-455]